MGEDSHVENDQSDVVEEQNTSCNRKTSDSKKVAYYKLFSFADSLDYALMGIGVISSIGIGLCLPLMTLLFGQLANSFGHNFDTPTLVSKVSEVSLKFVYLALGSGVAAFSQVSCWLITGERQAVRIRNLYLKAILRQDIGYFDKETSTGEIVERISSHTGIIQDAIGEKVGKFLQLSSSFIGGFVIAFSKGWLLTLVLLSAIPVLVLSAAVMTVMMAKLMSRGHAAYSEAAVVVEQTIASIRTVASFTGEKKAVDKYEKSLHKAYRASVQEGLAAGLGSGVFMLVLFCSYALAVWFGARMIINNGYSGGAVLNITMAVLLGSFSLGQISPCLTAFGAGQDVAFKVFETIHRKPEIDPYDTNGHVMSNLKGDVELRDVYFSYPTRPDEQILTSFSLTIPSGTTLALVGESGSGKSTIINLIERFYDPQHGEVLIDGVNVKEFRVGWIRGRIGLVSQEPVLFDSSIMENIAYGKTGASVEEIRVAAECAHAAKFIDKLPQGLDTLVGVNGNQLSGGQKQRIALARAILKDSKILLLDEATSALDAESEKIVQAALDRVTTNRTTIIVAHRLSTVKNADAIAVIRHGNVAEKGSHSELIRNPHGEYTRLVRLQDDDSFSIDKTARNHEETRDTDRKKTNQDFKTEVIRNPADDDDDISTDSFSIDQTASYHEETHTTDHMKMNQDFKTEAIRKPADDDESFSIDRTTPYHEETHTTDHKKKMNQDFKTDATQKPEDDDDSLSIDRTTPYHEETHTTNHNKTNQAIQKSDDDMNNSHHHSISIDKTASYHEETHNKTNQVSLYRLARLNKPEIPDLILGSIAAIINGSILPLFGLLFASVVKTFFEPHHKLQSDSKFWACMFVVLGTASFLATPTRTYFFAVAGSKLIKRLRLMCFAKVVHMEIGWFDLAENSSAVIGSRLSVDVKCVRNLVGESLALIVQNVATAVAGLVIGFGASWELSIVVLFMLPLIGLNGYLHMKFVTGFSADSKKLYEEATQVASDAVGNIRTVASFCAEEKVMELHQKKCAGPVKLSIRHGLLSGAGFGMSFFLLYSVYAASYYAGARLVEARRISFGDVFRVFLGLSMTAVGISQSGALAPDSGKARVSAASIFELIDHKSKIDSTDDSGMMLETVKGDITFQHVSFRYPNRPDVEILKDLSLTIQSGKMVAIVGESGSGKSTIISLLQRFYDPDSGQITIDGVEIQKLKLKWLRQQIGLVSQEPVLFNDTIRANIEYGKEENASEVEILAAAKLANADNFITALHKGYDKVVGERGIQLSGGQKQRVAIARALLKDPKILLLDEATSALDAESEKVVQDALERAMVDRTTIVVAHRLSTIKNADLIVVLKNGVVVEKGKHEALINKKHGFYVSLVSLPNVSTS